MLNLDVPDVFKILENDKLRDLLTMMLAHRYRTDILGSYYKLGDISPTLSYFGGHITPRALAENQIKFLTMYADQPIDVIRQEFWDRMLPNKRYNHLQDHIAYETKYSEISALVSDIILVSPVFKLFANYEHLEVVDVGSGKGKLGNMIMEINKINKSILEDQSTHGHINRVIHKTDVFSNANITFLNTDVYDWRDKEAMSDTGFALQDSAFHIPADDSSQDIAITKWCFHHMTRSQMVAQTKNLFRVLKPGGVSVVIEGFMTGKKSLPEFEDDASATFEKQLWSSYSHLANIDIWPEGPWKEDCIKISREYLSLSTKDQHAVLSFEDYFGHMMLNRRDTMQFPFTYIEAEELVDMFVNEGFEHEFHNFLMIGSAPIIRRGPFSARYIFRKPYPHMPRSRRN